MTKTLTLGIADLASANTEYQLTAQGSVSAPSRKIPEGVSRITKIVVAIAPDMAAAGAAVFLLRLGGVAVVGGEQVLVVGAAGGQLPQTGADPTGIEPIVTVLEDLDIEVKPDVINVSAEMAGDDLGECTGYVTLVFE